MMKEKKLEFGTAGIRGILGKGQGKLNLAHVQRVIHGFAKYLLKKYNNLSQIKVVIGRDNRKNSKRFAICAATILNEYKINAIYSDEITPTPFVSYVILNQHAQGGINITASHNPAKYNGIKLYNEMGSQCLPSEIELISKEFKSFNSYDESIKVPNTLSTKKFPFVQKYDPQWKKDYIRKLDGIDFDNKIKNIKVAYSPLHGTGSVFIKDLLDELGFETKENEKQNAFFVKEQMKIDPYFSTCEQPNPEKQDAYTLVKSLAIEKDADIILVTDPDSDRIGLGVKRHNDYIFLDGNETATIMSYYIMEYLVHKPYHDKYIVYSYVSTTMPEIIARSIGIKSFVVPTGFKWIGKIINEEKTRGKTCVYAFEESYGSLIDEDLSRDKDALQSVVLLLNMASFYKKKDLTLVDVLDQIYEKWGYVESGTLEIKLTAKTNLKKLQQKFIDLDLPNKYITDYNKKENFLKSNMIKIDFNYDNSWLALRPSGTEPKIKYYICAFAKSRSEAIKKYKLFEDTILNSTK